MNWILIKIRSSKIEDIRKTLWYTQSEMWDKLWLTLRGYVTAMYRWTMRPKNITELVKIFNRWRRSFGFVTKPLKEFTEKDIIIKL
jgi:hypothetical protein